MPQIYGSNETNVVQNKYKTFQDPVVVRTQEVTTNMNDSESNAPFRKRVRESASDNKRIAADHSAIIDPRFKQ